MKQFEILSGRCLVVELPEGATNPEIHSRSLTFDTPLEVDEWGYDYQAVKLPEGNWRIIGMLSEVTDGSLKDIVSTELIGAIGGIGGEYMYPNYLKSNLDGFDTALESLDSAILVEGYHIGENPLGAFQDFDRLVFNHSNQRLNEWKQAQSRALDRSRCLLLGREI